MTDINEFGYIHTISVTVFPDEVEPENCQLILRLDTREEVPAYGSNTGTAKATMEFIAEHLINIVGFSYVLSGSGKVADTLIGMYHRDIEGSDGAILGRTVHAPQGLSFLLYFIEMTDITEEEN